MAMRIVFGPAACTWLDEPIDHKAAPAKLDFNTVRREGRYPISTMSASCLLECRGSLIGCAPLGRRSRGAARQ